MASTSAACRHHVCDSAGARPWQGDAPADPTMEHRFSVGWRTIGEDGRYGDHCAPGELPVATADVDWLAFMHPDFHTLAYVVDGASTTERVTHGSKPFGGAPYLGDDPRGFVGWRDEATGAVCAGWWEAPDVAGDAAYVAVFADATATAAGHWEPVYEEQPVYEARVASVCSDGYITYSRDDAIMHCGDFETSMSTRSEQVQVGTRRVQVGQRWVEG